MRFQDAFFLMVTQKIGVESWIRILELLKPLVAGLIGAGAMLVVSDSKQEMQIANLNTQLVKIEHETAVRLDRIEDRQYQLIVMFSNGKSEPRDKAKQ